MTTPQLSASDYEGDFMDAETAQIFQSIVLPRLYSLFGEGNLFDPFLFGAFWDPSQPFPLWDLDDDEAIAAASSQIEWSEADGKHILRAQLPGLKKNEIQVIVEEGSVLEISGQWKKAENSCASEQECTGEWWEEGFVRRFKLPEDVNVEKMEAKIENDILSVEIPKGKPPRQPDQVKILQIKG